VWDCVFALLRQGAWVQQQLATEQDQAENTSKLIRLEQRKVLQTQNKITKIQQGFEAGLYAIGEAKARIVDCQNVIAKAEQEMTRIKAQMDNRSTAIDVDSLRRELEALAERNLEEATFEDKRDIINKLDIRVYPSEDLKTVMIKCGLRLHPEDKGQMACKDGCRIVMSGPPNQY